jgi:hypothetical protein
MSIFLLMLPVENEISLPSNSGTGACTDYHFGDGSERRNQVAYLGRTLFIKSPSNRMIVTLPGCNIPLLTFCNLQVFRSEGVLSTVEPVETEFLFR